MKQLKKRTLMFSILCGILLLSFSSASASVTSYDFVNERNIAGIGCQVWQGTNYFPESPASCVARTDMTSNPALDYDDNSYTNDNFFSGHKNFHFFVLKNVPRLSIHLDFAYISFNSDERGSDYQSVYIRNFKTRNWEFVNSVNVEALNTGNLDSSVGLSRDYIRNGEVWIISTGHLINSDYFSARITSVTPSSNPED